MPFDKLDIKAQEAAQNFRPQYNEDAWAKMEALLDEHMPLGQMPTQVEKKRRPQVWLLLLLFLAASVLLIIFLIPGRGVDTNRGHVSDKGNSAIHIPKEKTGGPQARRPNTETDQNTTQVNPLNSDPLDGNKNGGVAGGVTQTITPASNLTEAAARARFHTSRPANEATNYSGADETFTQLETRDPGNIFATRLIHQRINSQSAGIKNLVAAHLSIVTPPAARFSFSSGEVRSPANKKNSFKNSFSMSVSTGPDVSGVAINNFGTTKLLLGAGLGYHVGKRWLIRTGFYTVAKVYSADRAEYHAPANFWSYYPDLEHVDANCRVNSIPVLISYSFNENAKRSWFASAGVSSLFMKRETYNYVSKNASGQYQERSYTMRNENSHFLSMFTLSGGFQKDLSDKISFTTEPYVCLPLSGIGFGKVKLTSAGVLFSLSMKPFLKEK